CVPSFPCSTAASRDLYTLSLHDALPISGAVNLLVGEQGHGGAGGEGGQQAVQQDLAGLVVAGQADGGHVAEHVAAGGQGGVEARSEEHTSELQSRENLVCRLLLEKKKDP